MLVLGKMTPSEKEMAIASVQTKIAVLDRLDLKMELLKLVGQTHLDCGFKVDKETLAQTIDTLVDDLQKYNSSLSFQEIEIAFKNGWKKEYGDFFGLNNATYFGWVNAYTFGEKRLKVKKTLLEAKENANKQPTKKTEAEIDEIMKDACLRSFDDFRRNIPVVDAGNVKYNYLVKLGIINFTKERKLEIKNKVESILKAEAIENKIKTDTVEKALKRLKPETIVFESRKQALIDFYGDLVETETELSELIN
jgi:hypothetical protein